MTFQITWEPPAIDAATRFLKDDAEGLRQVFAAVDLLADNPRPTGSFEYGSPDLRRMPVGTYRVMYEIHGESVTIVIIHLGRTG
ncbi:type II toxin-antitoxin system RelE/ParE family toxin [Streptomyces roseoverticillatus]|uniref:type II toxin-antitoxin system RelE family toxin n=1 Tax=Streptomyces roseoverticillatus TaxID=66429 RepID=UPI001F2B42E0|nr:type II toxin-antitoxin system RelE/ParE family toxin [Streptomyces roseoverticillatus]MCF3104698.1 type II toxin-antitoxin system RelE/ParE family toxin [Streptomyces roseoverticillatus]